MTDDHEARIRAAVERINDLMLGPDSMDPDCATAQVIRDLLTEAETVPCPECGGSGDATSPHIGGGGDCPTCHGTGRIRRELAELHKFLEWAKTKRNEKGHMDRWNGAAGPVLEYIREKWEER